MLSRLTRTRTCRMPWKQERLLRQWTETPEGALLQGKV